MSNILPCECVFPSLFGIGLLLFERGRSIPSALPIQEGGWTLKPCVSAKRERGVYTRLASRMCCQAKYTDSSL